MNSNKIKMYLTKKFQEEGFSQISLEEIALNLRISKKTIYRDFTCKHELIEKTIIEMLNGAYDSVLQISSAESPFIEKFFSVFEIIKKNMKAFDDVSLRELKKSYPDIWLKAARFRKYYVLPLLRLLIESGIRKGVINNFPVELYMKLIYGSIAELTKRNHKQNESDPDNLLQIILNGALTRKGRKFLNHSLLINNKQGIV